MTTSVLVSKVMVWPRFEFDGWQGHYRRMARWLNRLFAVANKSEPTMDEQIDYALAYFQAAYHLRDYLAAEGVVSKSQLDELMAATPALRVCRDLCIGAKHRKINSPSVDPMPSILRVYSPGGEWPEDWHLIIKAGEIFDLVTLATECMTAWNAFLTRYNLDPHGLSPLASKGS